MRALFYFVVRKFLLFVTIFLWEGSFLKLINNKTLYFYVKYVKLYKRGDAMRKNRKLYNKNEAKKELVKMLLILLVFVPILLVLNFTLFKNLSSALRIFLDVVLCLGFIFVGMAVVKRVSAKKQEKQGQNNRGNKK